MESQQAKKQKVSLTSEQDVKIKWPNKRMEKMNSPLLINCAKCGGIPISTFDSHIKTCLNSDDQKAQPYLLLKVVSLGYYFLYIAATPSSTLQDVDEVLRQVWLDCCGHLSSFEGSGGQWTGEDEMRVKLQDVARVGSQFFHQYDMGTSTDSNVSVIGLVKAVLDKPIQVVGRNKDILHSCNGKKNRCTKPAVMIDGESYEKYCKDCNPVDDDNEDEDDDDDKQVFKILNSPRTGICGYGM